MRILGLLFVSAFAAAAILVFLAIALITPVRAETYAGHPVILDGDSLKIGRYLIRMHGIDAPELAQPCHTDTGHVPCGMMAKAALTQFINGQIVFCKIQGRGKYGRRIGKCYVGQHDLQAAMVGAGWAVAYTQYSKDYTEDQNRAWLNSAGMWAYRFTYPDQWRKHKR